MPTPDQKKKLLKAKIAVALHDELGRVPKSSEEGGNRAGVFIGQGNVQGCTWASFSETSPEEKRSTGYFLKLGSCNFVT